jgi:hypothetical protein
MRRLWDWVGRLADGISLWQVVGSFWLVSAMMSAAATGFNAVAEQGWGAIVFAGVFSAALLTLAATGSLALYRYFRPLPVVFPAVAPPSIVPPIVEVVPPLPPASPPEPEVIEWMPPSWALEEFGYLEARKAKLEIETKIQEANDRLGGLEADDYSATCEEIKRLERDKAKETWRIIWSLVHQLRNGELIAEGFADPADKTPVRISAPEWRKYTPDESELTVKRAVTLGSVQYIGVMIGRPKDDDIPF